MKVAANPTTQPFVTKLVEAARRYWSAQRAQKNKLHNPVTKPSGVSALFGIVQTQTTGRERAGVNDTRAALATVQLAARRLAARILSPTYCFTPA